MAKEQYSQIGYIAVTESAANTLTFNGLSVFSNVLGQKGMIIHRVEYAFTYAVMALLINTDDAFMFGISGTDSMAAVSLDDPEVYDYNIFEFLLENAGHEGSFVKYPFVKDFTTLPGQGIIVPADRIYGYIKGNSLAAAGGLTARFWYTIIDLTAADYLELAQAMRVLK